MRPLLAAAALLTLVACTKHDEQEDTATESAPAETGSKPVDHLAPGELLEGKEQLFGIVLPRDAHVDHSFKEVAYVSVDAPMQPLVAYVRTHVRDGAFTTSPMRSTFEHVHAPTQPGHEVRVEITAKPPNGCTMVIRDTTPAIVPPQPDEESRMRAAGLQRDGKPLDPTKVE